MIRISLKGLAKFMTGNSTSQRKVLRDFKYPDPEGSAQAIYYREARDFIAAYHRNHHPAQWIYDRASALESMAVQSFGQTQTRYRHNARALREYGRNFGNKNFEVLHDVTLALSFAGITITIAPELHVREKGVEKIIKLEFSKEAPDEKITKIVSQAMYEAQSKEGMGLSSSAVLYYDVRRGKIYKGARAGSRMRTEMESACRNIAALWNSI